MRSPGSGAFSTTHKLPDHLKFSGDLITPKNFRFIIECKKGYNKENLGSIFNLKSTDPGQYGKKITVDSAGEKLNEIKLQVISGTKIFDERNRSEGVSTSSADTTTKYLQEMNTMLLKGIQEFMRHASKSLSLGLQAGEIVTAYPKQNKNL